MFSILFKGLTLHSGSQAKNLGIFYFTSHIQIITKSCEYTFLNFLKSTDNMFANTEFVLILTIVPSKWSFETRIYLYKMLTCSY